MLTRFPLLLILLTAALARADFTIVQKVEGGMNSGQMTLRLKDDKARADIAPQISMITDLGTGDVITLQHATKVFIKLPGEQARAVFEKVKEQQKATGAEPPKLTATGRKEKVEQYACEVFTWASGEIRATDWIAKDHPNAAALLPALDRFQSAGLAGAARTLQPAMSELPGILIKREMTIGTHKTTTTLISVSDAPLDAAIFTVPADYKVQPAPAFQLDGAPPAK